jgi:hypothetical protein
MGGVYGVDSSRRSRDACYLKVRRSSGLPVSLTKLIYRQPKPLPLRSSNGDMASRYGAVSSLLERDSIEVRRGQSGEQDPSPQEAPSRSLPTTSSVRSDSIGEGRTDGVVREKLNDEASWIPAALRRRSLLAFIAAYTVLIVVLAVLFSYSNQHDGLATSDEKFHYLWTYGPTAGRLLAQHVCVDC